jgi:hypothetical protein
MRFVPTTYDFKIAVAALIALLPVGDVHAASANTEFYQGKTIKLVVSSSSGGGYDTLDVAMAPLLVGRPYVAPPHVPAYRVAGLRGALHGTFRDVHFLEEAAKMRLEVDAAPQTGEDILSVLTRTYAAPKPVLDRLIAIYEVGPEASQQLTKTNPSVQPRVRQMRGCKCFPVHFLSASRHPLPGAMTSSWWLSDERTVLSDRSLCRRWLVTRD